VKLVRPALAAAVFIMLLAPAARAQTDSVVAVGVAATFYDPASADAHHPAGVGIVARLRRGSGLGATVGMDWFTSDLRVEAGGQPTPVGRMSIKPLMAGVGYIKQFRRYAISTGVVAGIALNTLSQSDSQRAAWGDHAGLPGANVSISNCLAVEPNLTLWYELGHHFAASASVAYMVARPSLTASSAAGTRSERINLSATVITFGFVYGVF
jgi:hypothetical protein